MRSSSKILIMRKVGGFYHVFDDDAYILFHFFNYKIVNGKCGFPLSSISKILEVLDNNKINYLVFNSDDDKIERNFKNSNKYSHYCNIGIREYQLYKDKLIIDERIRKLSIDKVEELYKRVNNYVQELENC